MKPNKYQKIFLRYVNAKGNLCEVEDVMVEEKRILFNLFLKETIFHRNSLGYKFIHIDIFRKQVLASEFIEDKDNVARMLEIREAIDKNKYRWQPLFSYGKTCFNNKAGIVNFMDEADSQCLASFLLDDAELRVMTPQGWVSYKFEK